MPGTNFTWTRLSGGNRAIQNAFEAIDTAIGSATTPGDNTVTSAKIVDGAIVNADINASAAIAYSKLASLTAAHVLVGNGSGVATDVAVSGDISMANDGTTAIAAGVVVNADVNASAAIAYSKMAALTDSYILVGNGSNVCTAVAVSGDVAMANDGSTTVTDLTISSEAQGDILYRNASNWTRLAAGTAGQALITAGAGSNPYWGEPAVALASKLTGSFVMEAGTYDITHAVTTQTSSAPTLTIPDFAGVSDTYAFLTLAQTFTGVKTFNQTSLALKGGDANACTIKINETLTGAKTLNIKPNDGNRTVDISGDITTAGDLVTSGAYSLTLTTTNTTDVTLPTTGTLATLAGSETFTNKTFTAPKIATTGYIADAGGDEYLKFVESSTPVNYIQITSADTGTAPRVQGAGETNVDLLLLGSGSGNVYVADAADPTKDLTFELSGATTDKTTTIASSQTDDRTLTLPDATDTLVGKATTDILTNKTLTAPVISSISNTGTITLFTDTDTVVGKATTDILTNKTIDCDGAGNAITNVNADELDSVNPGASAVYGVNFTISYELANQGAAVNLYSSNAPFKFRVMDAWSVSKSADGGTWKLDNGTNDLCSAVTVAASDTDIDRIVDLDDDYYEIAANGSLRIVPDAGGALDAVIYISCIRVD